MTSEIVPAEKDKATKIAILKMVGFEKLSPEERELGAWMSRTYDLRLELRHMVVIDGRLFTTRDGLLWIAHRSGQFDGLSVTRPVLEGDHWRCEATVYRKDMAHPFVYPGRYPVKGSNARFAEEMAIKVAESMALRRAFNVATPILEERWDRDVEAEPPAPPQTLAERVAAARERTTVARDAETAVLVEPMPEDESARHPGTCGAVFDGETDDPCILLPGHDGAHQGKGGSEWR